MRNPFKKGSTVASKAAEYEEEADGSVSTPRHSTEGLPDLLARDSPPKQGSALQPITVKSSSEQSRSRHSLQISRPVSEDYKLSSVTPTGEFMPPSPPTKDSVLSNKSLAFFRRSRSEGEGASPILLAKRESFVDDDGGFVIPRASFEGYRRSFDIRPSMEEQRPSKLSLGMSSIDNGSVRESHSIFRRKDDNSGGNGITGLAPPLEPDEFENIDIGGSAATAAPSEPRKRHFWSKLPTAASKNSLAPEEGAELSSIYNAG